jgi:hypothetical protein
VSLSLRILLVFRRCSRPLRKFKSSPWASKCKCKSMAIWLGHPLKWSIRLKPLKNFKSKSLRRNRNRNSTTIWTLFDRNQYCSLSLPRLRSRALKVGGRSNRASERGKPWPPTTTTPCMSQTGTRRGIQLQLQLQAGKSRGRDKRAGQPNRARAGESGGRARGR